MKRSSIRFFGAWAWAAALVLVLHFPLLTHAQDRHPLEGANEPLGAVSVPEAQMDHDDDDDAQFDPPDNAGNDLPLVSLRGMSLVPEFCPPNTDCPTLGVTLRRTGPGFEQPLTVLLRYEGTAAAGVDYGALPESLTFEAGKDWAFAQSRPLDDDLVEGDETVVAHLVQPPPGHSTPYRIAADAASVSTIILDNEPSPLLKLEIVAPTEGQQFGVGDLVSLRAEVIGDNVDRPWKVEFFGGDRLIGQTRAGETVRWEAANEGPHSISARATDAAGMTLAAEPIKILVGPGPALPVVSVVAEPSRTGEPCPTCLVAPAVLVFKRTGPTLEPLVVFVQTDGTATAGEDYERFPTRVEIRAGEQEVQLNLLARDDQAAEGPEVVRVRVVDPPTDGPQTYLISEHASAAMVTILDDEADAPGVRLDIIEPADGSEFPPGATIRVSAIGVYSQGEVYGPVEFYAGGALIGKSVITVETRPPIPGLPSVHSILWTDPPPGEHVLKARTEISPDRWITSPPVRITVGPGSSQPPKIAITRPASGVELPPNAPIEIVAEARDPDGYVPKVEFFAGDRKIGEQNFEFIRPPDPGQVQVFTFVWRHPTPSRQVLTARATADDNGTAWSPPVEIRVAMPDHVPVVRVTVRDAFAVEPGADAALDAATFRVRRFGPTEETLTVAYTLHGTAQNGVDFELVSGWAIIPAGERVVPVTVQPLADDAVEGIETVIFHLEDRPQVGPIPEVPLPGYRVGLPRRAVAIISDEPLASDPVEPFSLRWQDGLLHLCFGAESGRNFRIESSTDLRNWETLSDTTAVDDALHFVDDQATDSPQRFYRLTPEPVPE